MVFFRTKKSIYPLIIITLCAVFQFYKYVLQVYPSIITTELMQSFHLNGMGLGNLAATFYYSFIVSQLLVGFILDKLGIRTAAFAIFLCALGVYIFAGANTMAVACAARALIGIGVAFSTVVYMKMAAEWFSPKSYPFVSGLIATATMAGAVFGELPLSHWMAYAGWRQALAMLGVMGFVLAIIFAIVVRDKKKPEAKKSLTYLDLKNVIFNKQNWLMTLYGGLTFAPVSIFGGLWGNPFLKAAYQFNEHQAAFFISLIFIGLGLGSPLLGLFAERIGGRERVIFLSTLLAGLCMTLVLCIRPMPLPILGVLLFLLGFGVSGYILIFSIAKDLNSSIVTGTVIAMINAGDALLTGVTEPIIGRLLDLTADGKVISEGGSTFSIYGYQLALSVLPIFLAIAAFIIHILRKQDFGEIREKTLEYSKI